MKITIKHINDLIPYDKNAKIHTEDQIKNLAEAITLFGFHPGIEVDKNGVIISGHARLEAAKLLGLEEVKIGVDKAEKGEKFIPVTIRTDLTPEEAKIRRIADNRLNESEWDVQLLNVDLESLSLEDQELTGFTTEELASLGDEEVGKEEKKAKIKEVYEIVIECKDEEEQQKNFNRLEQMGFKCKIISI